MNVNFHLKIPKLCDHLVYFSSSQEDVSTSQRHCCYELESRVHLNDNFFFLSFRVRLVATFNL